MIHNNNQFTIADVKQLALRQWSHLESVTSLDIEIIIAEVCQLSRTVCYAYPDRSITSKQYQLIEQYLSRRAQGEPLAYLLGKKEFWSLEFKVTPATLVPRPETECLVEWVLAQNDKNTDLQVADLGTGTGAIAVALASERPAWKIDAVDQSVEALSIAKYNVKQHGCSGVSCIQGSWCHALPCHDYNLIISNPPYIDPDDQCLEELRFEPISALAAEQKGLADIATIIQQAPDYLQAKGCCVIEHGAMQAESVRDLMRQVGFIAIKSLPDLSGFDRFTVGVIA